MRVLLSLFVFFLTSILAISIASFVTMLIYPHFLPNLMKLVHDKACGIKNRVYPPRSEGDKKK